jgi:hypothetical protein
MEGQIELRLSPCHHIREPDQYAPKKTMEYLNMVTVEEKFAALKALGVGEFTHLNGSLESHLHGTHKLLRQWGNPEFVCDAGLYHASYGTQPMKKLGLAHKEFVESDRPHIQKIIGIEAENLVYLYAACDRDYVYPQIGADRLQYRDRFTKAECILPPDTLSRLLEITLANELEICLKDSGFMQQNRTWFVQLFDRVRGLVSVSAFNYYQQVFDLNSPD